jgi:hypothetical protein
MPRSSDRFAGEVPAASGPAAGLEKLQASGKPSVWFHWMELGQCIRELYFLCFSSCRQPASLPFIPPSGAHPPDPGDQPCRHSSVRSIVRTQRPSSPPLPSAATTAHGGLPREADPAGGSVRPWRRHRPDRAHAWRRHVCKELGQQVIIDNKPGAGTIIGTDAVAKSAPDGYTIVIATFAHAVNPSLVPKLPYATDKAFTPITLIGRGPNVLVVRADSPLQVGRRRRCRGQGQAGQAHLRVAGQRHFGAPGRRDVHEPGQGRDDPRAVSRRGSGHHRLARRPGGHDLRHGRCGLQHGRQRQAARLGRDDDPSLPAAFKGVPTIAATVPGYAVESWYGLYAPGRHAC